jgi:hypothetical protein
MAYLENIRISSASGSLRKWIYIYERSCRTCLSSPSDPYPLAPVFRPAAQLPPHTDEFLPPSLSLRALALPPHTYVRFDNLAWNLRDFLADGHGLSRSLCLATFLIMSLFPLCIRRAAYFARCSPTYIPCIPRLPYSSISAPSSGLYLSPVRTYGLNIPFVYMLVFRYTFFPSPFFLSAFLFRDF